MNNMKTTIVNMDLTQWATNRLIRKYKINHRNMKNIKHYEDYTGKATKPNKYDLMDRDYNLMDKEQVVIGRELNKRNVRYLKYD